MDGVRPDYSGLHIVQRDEAETLPDGMYEIETGNPVETLVDICHYAKLTGRTRTVLRIDAGDELPLGVEETRYRADGKRLVIAKFVDDPDATFEDGFKLLPQKARARAELNEYKRIRINEPSPGVL